MSSQKIKVTTQLSYGIGQIAGQIFRDVPSLLLLFFMTNVLGISAAIAGTAIFLPKFLVGAAGDMTVGILIDKWRGRVPLYGWLLFGAITAPIAMVLLFTVPEFAALYPVPYIMVIMSVYMLIFASFSVPYLAIASALAKQPHQRTVLMGWRLVFTAIGMLIAGGIAPAIVDSNGQNASAYTFMAIILAVLCTLSLFIAFWGSRSELKKIDEEKLDASIAPRVSFKDMMAAIRIPRFSVLVSCNILQLTGTGMSYATMLYYLTYVMALDNALSVIGIVLGMTILGIILAQPVWVAISKRVGKKKVYIMACLVHAAALILWALIAKPFGLNGVFIAAFLVGVGNSGWVMAGFSMVSDIAGEGRAGLFSAVWIAADKIAFALGGTLLVGLWLSAWGFDSVAATIGSPQPLSALTGITWAFALIPAICYVIGAAMFHLWGSETQS